MSYPPLNYIGYGKNPPQANWPNQSRLAINFVINYEEGAELNILHGDDESEHYLTEITYLPSYSGERHPFSESIFEYGARRGIWRLLDLFNHYAIPTTLFACGQAAEINPEVIKEFSTAHHEIAGHGYRWIDYKNIEKKIEQQHVKKTIDILQQLSGKKILGWYTGRRSENTREIIMAEKLLYDSDNYSDDLPFWLTLNKKPHLIIPYTFDLNDAKYFMTPGWMSGDDFFSYLKNAFDCLYEEGKLNPKMMTIALHARISGRPGRLQAVKHFLAYLKTFNDIWLVRRQDIALHWCNISQGENHDE